MNFLKLACFLSVLLAYHVGHALSFNETLTGSVIQNNSEYDFEHPDSYNVDELVRKLDLHEKTETAFSLKVKNLELTDVAHFQPSLESFNRVGNIVSAESIILSQGASQVWSFKVRKGSFYFLTQRTAQEFYSLRYMMELEDTQTHELYQFYGYKQIIHAHSDWIKIPEFLHDTTVLYVSLFKLADARSATQLQEDLTQRNQLKVRPAFVGKIEISALNLAKSIGGLSISNSPPSSLSYAYDFLKFYFTKYEKTK